ncbi:MAG: redoxin domain-containing protein [Isosphaeraceae bacterium]
MSIEHPIDRKRWTRLAPRLVVLALAAILVEQSVEWAMDLLFEDRGTTVAAEPTASRSTVTSTRGRLLYQVHCQRCHGTEGRGDGSDAANLRPPPKDLANTIGDWSREKVARSIVEGKRDTAMSAFGETFPRRDLDALVDHVRSFRREGQAVAATPMSSMLVERLQRAGFTPAQNQRPAPRLSVRDVAGRTVSLDEHRNRLVLIAFWGATCGPCLKELPALERLADQFREAGLIVLPVCFDPCDATEAAEVASSRVSHLPVFADADGSDRIGYDVQVLPTTVLIDQAGRLIGTAQGSRGWDQPEMCELIKTLLTQP